MANLHMSLDDFYGYSPIEINYALKVYYDGILEDTKLSWEQTRIQIYYQYLLTPSKKRKVGYNIFKKDYLPFSFDEKRDDTEIIDDEQFGSIMDIFDEKEKTVAQ